MLTCLLFLSYAFCPLLFVLCCFLLFFCKHFLIDFPVLILVLIFFYSYSHFCFYTFLILLLLHLLQLLTVLPITPILILYLLAFFGVLLWVDCGKFQHILGTALGQHRLRLEPLVGFGSFLLGTALT